MVTIRLQYDSTMGNVGRVLRAIDSALGERGQVWARGGDTVEGRSDSDFEPARGFALVDVYVDDRQEAHDLVGHAMIAEDPDRTIVVAPSDIDLTPIQQH